MSAKYIQIPDTDLSLYPLGFGTVRAGGDMSDAVLADCIGCYLDLGGNVIDTARVYTDGRSEEALGRYFTAAKNRDKFVLITKGGHPPMSDLHHSRCSEAEVMSDIETSLKCLKTDCIDIYFYHRDDVKLPVSHFIDLMEKLVKQGKIRYYGCSNWTTARMKEADAYAASIGARGFVANEMFHNLGMKYMKPFPDDTLVLMDDEMYAYHKQNPRCLAIPYFSVCSGFFHRMAANPHDPTLKNSPYYTEGNLKVFERVKEMMHKYGASVSQVVLGFYTASEFAEIPLYGPENTESVKDAAGYAGIDFDPQDFIL